MISYVVGPTNRGIANVVGISIFGGHGVIEDFSALPRIFRDAMVNELWEGPATCS